MTIYYRATIECDAQSSVKCAGVLGVTGETTTLEGQAILVLERKGWTRIPKYLERPRDVCPACAAALAERGPR